MSEPEPNQLLILQSMLRDVRSRRWLQVIVDSGWRGLLVSMGLVLFLSVVAVLAGRSVAPVWLVVFALIGPVVGVIYGLRHHPRWLAIAALVDQQCRLSDRVATAMELSASEGSRDAMTQLQAADAEQSLRNADLCRVSPWRPRTIIQPVLTVIAMIAVLAVSLQIPAALQANEEPADDRIVAAALDDLTASIEALGSSAELLDSDELRETAARLRAQLSAQRVQPMEARDALASISEMRMALSKEQRALDVKQMDRQLQNLASALASSSAFQTAAEALKQGDLQSAADELETVQPSAIDASEAQAAADKLQEVADAMKDAGFNSFSDKVSALSESLASEDAQNAARQAQELAQPIRKQQMVREMSQMLDRQLSDLAEARREIQRVGSCPICGGNCLPGQCQAEQQPGAAGSSVASAEEDLSSGGGGSQGNTAGTAAGRDVEAVASELEATLQMARLKGQLSSEGATSTETTTVLQEEATARRIAQEVYREYQQMSDAVLDEEEIPLGQKQMIRRYFESIRPK